MSHLPRLTQADFETSSTSAYFGAMGFEDRALEFIQRIHEKKGRVGHIFAIEYLPFNEENRVEQFMRIAKEVCDDVKVITFDRFLPEDFSRTVGRIVSNLACDSVVVDVSGLTRLGIVVITTALTAYEGRLTIFYGEAETYHPTHEDYEKERKRLGPSILPTFLTTGVYDVLSTSSLSSVSMAGSPLALVAFPTFNHVELGALLTEITPERLFLVNGMPPDAKNKWRRDAIHELNASVLEFGRTEKTTSTLLYEQTVDILNELYSEVQYTHRLVVAPTGSKMQSLGVSLFKQIHPDVEIIHPVAEGYFSQYTEGIGNAWQVDFSHFKGFVDSLHSLRKESILETLSQIETRQR